jgi:uncharacterized protein (TIGR00730 family)
MAARRIRYRTGSPDLDARIDELLDAAGATEHRALLFEILVSAVRLARDDVDPLDLKITNAALKEMRNAFRIFQPYRDIPKVSVFGSARTHEDDPLYAQARSIASVLAAEGWMVVTGAGPGIMAAAMEGAGTERSLGVSIRLPFEQQTNSVIAADGKLVSMKYFFTRKLMLVKESKAFVCLPGGFGTLDETFELLTLTQTGKGMPVPIVFLDIPGGTYWEHCRNFIQAELVSRALVTPEDIDLFLVTDDVDRARAEICGFYANYDSMRFVGNDLVVRLRRAPTAEQLADLNERFGDLAVSGGIVATTASAEEIADDDAVDLPRIKLAFNKRRTGVLRRFIDALNHLGVPAGEDRQ